MSEDAEKERLKACLEEIRWMFQDGPGSISPHAPQVMKLISEGLGWELPPKNVGSVGCRVPT